jgi:cytochrome c556
MAYMERHEAMEELGEAILVLNDMSAEEIPVDEDAFLGAARTIATGAGTLLDHFENQTIVPESRAKPEIWQNWDDFVAKNDALVTASNALVEAASSGGFAAGRSLVAPMRDTCGGCHRPYRGPEKE